MTFAFQPKSENLNWDMLATADIDSIIQRNDIGQLEQMLQNLSNARLEPADLRRIADRNYIKLFKVSQLSLEYMLFLQSQSEFMLSAKIREQQHLRANCAKLEDKVRSKQKQLVNTKAAVRVKQQTL